MPPLLSIGVPTFNRAHLLQDLLQNLVRECLNLEDQVEIVISDNCSDDHTSDLVASFSDQLPIRYHRNDRNIGPAANVAQIPSLASGQYCWMFGDDDLLVPGALSEVLRLLKENPRIPAIVVGYSYQKEVNRKNYIGEDSPIIFERPVFTSDHGPKLIPRWEDTFSATNAAALHTAIVSCVFSRQEWMQNSPSIESLKQVEALTSLESTFPHTMAWASSLVGKPVIFAPRPFVYFFVGSQDWFKPKWLTIVFSYCLELAQYFRQQGAKEEAVRYYESLLLTHSGLASLIVAPNEYAKAHFSLAWLMRHYGLREELWRSLAVSAESISCRLVPVMIHRCVLECWRFPKTWWNCSRTMVLIASRHLAACLLVPLKRRLRRLFR